MTNEQKAIELSNDKMRLLKRLKDARYALSEGYRKGFGKGKFDFENRRLIGSNRVVLQWQLRDRPDLPESTLNQQTSIGIVIALYI